MKKTLLLLAISASILASNSYADKSDCNSNAIHCGYFAGLNEKDLSDTRYFRYDVNIGMLHNAVTLCVNNRSTIEVLPAVAPSLVGKNTSFTVSICHDKYGHDCQLIDKDIYKITKSGQEYIGTPKYHRFDVKAAAGSFDRCAVSKQHYIIF